MKANEVLKKAQKHLEDRGVTYDSPANEERSIFKTVDAFNRITNTQMSYEEGWLFMALLKIVRSQQGEYKPDNYEDLAAYAALMGEQAHKDRGQKKQSPVQDPLIVRPALSGIEHSGMR